MQLLQPKKQNYSTTRSPDTVKAFENFEKVRSFPNSNTRYYNDVSAVQVTAGLGYATHWRIFLKKSIPPDLESAFFDDRNRTPYQLAQLRNGNSTFYTKITDALLTRSRRRGGGVAIARNVLDRLGLPDLLEMNHTYKPKCIIAVYSKKSNSSAPLRQNLFTQKR